MIREHLGRELLFFDGGMGTVLQEKGLLPGELPESWNISHGEEIQKIHREYIKAGSDIILTNTFGANALKFHATACSLEEVVKSAVRHAKAAADEIAQERKVYVALDVGPTGKLLKPMGDLEFERAYEVFREVIIYGKDAGVDLIHIETMSDTYELKAAVLAAKENTDLPVFATTIFDERRKLLTGADVPAVVALLEGLRVDALGINCGLGPEQMLPVLEEIMKYTSLPVIVKPNAGLPKQKDSRTCYDVTPREFGETMKKVVRQGASIIGGCCGTTLEHIRQMVKDCQKIPVKPVEEKNRTVVSSYGRAVFLGTGCSKIIGERINPTGKKKLKQALKDHDLDYILKEGIVQQEKGAHILDVNVGLPDIDEPSVLQEVIENLQSVINLPLQIDTVNMEALEKALRIYNGKAMINSVNGKQESMDAVFPLIQKYGGAVVGLTLDESGIPSDVDGRIRIAEKIVEEAAKYGIKKKDIVIDALAMTISSEPEGARITLETLRRLKEEVKVNTVLGVSNISFGLPQRPVINAAFYAMCMQNGLSAGIINPASEEMMKSWHAFHALMNLDANCEHYIERYGDAEICPNISPVSMENLTLQKSIEKGLKEEAYHLTTDLLQKEEPLSIINAYMIPALDNVGRGFERGTVFLPQLLMSAEAAKTAFSVLKDKIEQADATDQKKEKIVLATVKGDIHDIGKNIVKVLLENYGFEVIDLGKDVPAQEIVETVKRKNIKLVGLSALMTTTVVSMEETIRRLREETPQCKVMVGGAVLNQEYADQIGADFYGKDAMQSVYYAKELFRFLYK